MIPEPSCFFFRVNLGRTEMNDDSFARVSQLVAQLIVF